MKNKLLITLIGLLLLPVGLYAASGGGGGGGCTPSDNQGSPTSVSSGTTYSFDNSGCNATSCCEDPVSSCCGSSTCTYDECVYDLMGALYGVTSCFCGSPENTAYAQFCPTSTGTYTFQTSSISCSGGAGTLQWGVGASSNSCSTGYDLYCTNGTTSNENIALSLTGGTCYRIFFDGNAGAACTFNFYIVPPPLPVKMLSLTAEPGDEGVLVKWATATEINNNYFSVERSKDGSDFKSLGIVRGSGNSSTKKDYAYFDKSPPEGMCYYRIKQVDMNGKFEVSLIVAVYNKGNKEFELKSIYPSVAKDNISLSYNSNEETDVDIFIFNGQGKQFGKYPHRAKQGSNSIDLNISNLGKGTYYAIIQKGSERKLSRFVKL